VSAAGGILVIDAPGAIFAALRSARLGVALWRSTGKARAADTSGFALAIVAAYEQPDWHAIGQLVERIPTIIVAAQHNDEQANRAVSIGAFGYIPATLSADAMRRAVLGATEGEPAYSRRLLAQRLRSLARPQYSGKALTLTPRQREVVTLIAQGAADKEIAGALGITTATAQKHVTNLLKRLNVPNRAAAAALLVSSMSLAPSESTRVSTNGDLTHVAERVHTNGALPLEAVQPAQEKMGLAAAAVAPAASLTDRTSTAA
jgi:DNA-binding NarL/FixJ family response regulator